MKFCKLHEGKKIINIQCKHEICEKGIEDNLIRDLKDFCGKYIYNQSILYDSQEHCIRCPYPGCFSKYLYSTDTFLDTFNLVFDEYGFESNHRTLILWKFEGFKIGV